MDIPLKIFMGRVPWELLQLSRLSAPFLCDTRHSPRRIAGAKGLWVEMKQVNAGSLRAIGYDPSQRVLRVELTNGSLMEYGGVSEDTWRRFASSGSQWSFFRDNIEENYTERRVR